MQQQYNLVGDIGDRHGANFLLTMLGKMDYDANGLFYQWYSELLAEEGLEIVEKGGYYQLRPKED